MGQDYTLRMDWTRDPPVLVLKRNPSPRPLDPHTPPSSGRRPRSWTIRGKADFDRRDLTRAQRRGKHRSLKLEKREMLKNEPGVRGH